MKRFALLLAGLVATAALALACGQGEKISGPVEGKTPAATATAKAAAPTATVAMIPPAIPSSPPPKVEVPPTQPPPAQASSCKIGAISWQDAAKHGGSTATVEGPVVGTQYASSSNGKPTFLNVGKPYPDPARFTVVIWGENRGKFSKPPESLYKGKDICVSGVVQMYQGSPQIVVDSPDHIALAD